VLEIAEEYIECDGWSCMTEMRIAIHAHEADYGIAGGKDCGLLFRRGEILGKYPADKLADALVDLILSEK